MPCRILSLHVLFPPPEHSSHPNPIASILSFKSCGRCPLPEKSSLTLQARSSAPVAPHSTSVSLFTALVKATALSWPTPPTRLGVPGRWGLSGSLLPLVCPEHAGTSRRQHKLLRRQDCCADKTAGADLHTWGGGGQWDSEFKVRALSKRGLRLPWWCTG